MSNRVVVHKFGGACFKDAISYQKVIELLHNSEKPWIAIPSAFFGVTDKIHSLLKSTDPEQVKKEIQYIRSYHLEIGGANIKEIEIKKLDHLLDELERLLTGIALTGEISAHIRDYVLSFGERLAAICLQVSLQGEEPFILDPVNVLRTNGVFYEASVLLTESERLAKERLLPLLDKNTAIIIPGYYGGDNAGNVTLLGRSGTDYAAASIAYLANASSINIWKDVPAFMTADPKLIEEAEPLSFLDYEATELLTLFGAKLIHPKTLGPVKAKGIPLYIRHLHDMNNYTLIGSEKKHSPSKPVLSLKKDLAMISIYMKNSNSAREVIDHLLQNFNENGIPVYGFLLIGAKIQLLISESHISMLQTFLHSFDLLHFDSVSRHAILIVGSPPSILSDFLIGDDVSMITFSEHKFIVLVVSADQSISITKMLYSHVYANL